MKKFNNRKSVLERGGLMIEALAMLGLIAVVTPTMYKKSAERTMEVEDINTASAIRTYMNGVESLLSANYTELMEKIPEPTGDKPTMIPLEEIKLTIPSSEVDENGNPIPQNVTAQQELEKYLPYGYSAKDNLYNYGQPKFVVARSGNNLSAYVVFPSKASDDENGIGQERTVRIASLIGSNGGYIRDDGGNSARGVGGTWSLQGSKTVMDKDGNSKTVKEIVLKDAGKYSIVTSSIDIVNSGEGMGGDMTKYLQRTAENGEIEKWRNTMRTDIYMGELNNSGYDYDDKTTNGYFSIRNINQLIVGADGAAADDEHNRPGDQNRDNLYVNERYVEGGEGVEGSEGDSDARRGLESYGLYIADETDETRGQYGVNAYIAGSLEAAGKRLFTDENELTYHGPRVQLGGIDEDETTGLATKYLITAITENDGNADEENTEETEQNSETQGKNRVEIMPVSKTSGTEGNTVTTSDALIIASDSDLNDEVTIGTISQDTNKKGTNLLLAKGGDKTVDGTTDAPEIDYTEENNAAVPQFPVVVDSNMAVNGVLAAGQLDTQKIRASSMSVGSEHINDDLKWMDVDEAGVHIHSITTGSAAAADDGTEPAKAKMQLEVNDNIIAMRAGSDVKNLNDADNEPTEHESQFIMDDSGVKIIAQDADGNAALDHSIELTTGKKGITEHLENNEMSIGSLETSTENNTTTVNANPYRVKYEANGHVDMVGTTLQVTDNDAKPVFSIRGNNAGEKNLAGGDYNDPTIYKSSENNGETTVSGADFKIAAHGNTVFTSDAVSNNSENNATKFLAMGVEPEEDKFLNDPYMAAVNIVSNRDTGGYSSKRVIYIDLNENHQDAYVGERKKETNATGQEVSYYEITDDSVNPIEYPRKMMEGSIYIRKGLIDITPSAAEINDHSHSADAARGTVRASRFVANNVDEGGHRITYENTLASDDYDKYGETTNVKKYDTYMVNPAYTSVMKDIKLTSRFGARLSDVLPDFITKRIYLSTNSYGEDTATPTALEELTGNNQLSEGSSVYASPYLGSVARPACPPGYGRAITVIPIGFEMGTVGSLERITRDLGSTSTEGGTHTVVTSVDVSQASMLGHTIDGTTGGYSATNGVYNTSYKDANDMLSSQPAYGRIRNLSQGLGKNGSAVELIPAQLQTTNGSAKTGGGQWGVDNEEWEADGERFYTGTGQLHEENGDLENRLQLVGGVDQSAVENYKLSPSEALFDDRSVADLRNKTFYIDHFGYSSSGQDNADKNIVSDTNNDNLALRAEVRARTYDETGLYKEGVDIGEGTEGAYFLVADDASKRPITFQKSTWLKTAATDIKQGTESDSFKSGWKVYMGFIYPEKLYGQIASALGVASNLSTATMGTETAYWNLFPVMKGTLTAYSTTYCFIDNKSTPINGSVVSWDTDTLEAGNIQYDVNEWNTDFSAPKATQRNEYLNDPALKYNEVW